MCYAQRHLKRLLAFSTISHVGVIVCGVGLLTAHGLAGAATYVIGHGFTKGALFMLVGVLAAPVRDGGRVRPARPGTRAQARRRPVRRRGAGAERPARCDAVLRQVAARRSRARDQLPLVAHGVRDLLDSHRRARCCGSPAVCSWGGEPPSARRTCRCAGRPGSRTNGADLPRLDSAADADRAGGAAARRDRDRPDPRRGAGDRDRRRASGRPRRVCALGAARRRAALLARRSTATSSPSTTSTRRAERSARWPSPALTLFGARRCTAGCRRR